MYDFKYENVIITSKTASDLTLKIIFESEPHIYR